jgi:hypothetical protein
MSSQFYRIIALLHFCFIASAHAFCMGFLIYGILFLSAPTAIHSKIGFQSLACMIQD